MKWEFDFIEFGKILQTELQKGDALRAIAKKTGVSASTLSRAARGKTIDVNSLVNITEWMITERNSIYDITHFVRRANEIKPS